MGKKHSLPPAPTHLPASKSASVGLFVPVSPLCGSPSPSCLSSAELTNCLSLGGAHVTVEIVLLFRTLLLDRAFAMLSCRVRTLRTAKVVFTRGSRNCLLSLLSPTSLKSCVHTGNVTRASSRATSLVRLHDNSSTVC